ncbi:MAG: hypothetical protein K6U77_05500 [Armatimonadetes bacterium]|nr:hypothetical protein [Armatimonadota bacterium]
MAVSGVRDTEQERLSVWDGLMFWGVQYRRLSLAALLRGVWFFALWAGLSAALLAPVLAQVKGGAGLYLLLGWVAALHLLGRGWLERRLPDPSFAQDVRTGNFEQLRIVPLTAHGLLVQRGLPDMLFRAATQSVWLPVYAIVVGALGASLADACALWLLFSFANYFVLGLVSLILLIPSEEIHWILLCGLLAYALLLDGGRVRTAVSSSSLFSVMLALPIVGRVLLPIQAMATLPNLLPFVLVWLLVEWLRFERLARWVNAPSGLGRWAYLLPSAALMAAAGALFGQWCEQTLSAAGAARTQLGVSALFAAVGYLSLLLLTLRRQAEPIVQPLRAHLLETGLLRLMSVLLAVGAVAVGGLPMGSAAFWGVLVWLTVVEWLAGALARWQLQRAHSRTRAGAYLALLLGVAPAVVFWIEPFSFIIGALSPVYALVLASSAWASTGVAGQPPLWACFALPVARYALVLGVLALITLTARATQPTKRLHPAWGWLALPLLYPLLDWLVQRNATNPITRLTIAERCPPFAPVIGLAVFALALPLGNIGWTSGWLVAVVLGLFLWLWGYYATAKRVRRWLDSGELTSAFLAGLTPNQIFWGWVYGAWYQQLRVLLAAFGGWLWGVSLFLWLNAGRGGWNPVQWLTLWLSVGLAFYLVYLALWSCAWLIAAPAAIRDQLTHTGGGAPVLTPRATLQASVYSLLACCAPLAPFLLIGLPIYASQSTLALHRMARAPGELSRRYGISN